MPHIDFIQNISEGNKVLTNNDLGNNLTLVFDYNMKRRQVESDFAERLQRLDTEYMSKVGKCAGVELEAKIQSKLRENQNMNYNEAFSQAQNENPVLVKQYDQEIHG